MKQQSNDQKIVQALNFGNLVLLSQCIDKISYSSMAQSFINEKKQQKFKSKSKFEKVSKIKTNGSRDQGQNLSKQSYSNFSAQNQNLLYPRKFAGVQFKDLVNSKIRINSTQLDRFQTPFINNSYQQFTYRPVQSKILKSTMQKQKLFLSNKQQGIDVQANNFYDQSFENLFVSNKPLQSKIYDVEDLLKSTSVIKSKNKQSSPINAWKSTSNEKDKNIFYNSSSQTKFHKSTINTKSQILQTHKNEAYHNQNDSFFGKSDEFQKIQLKQESKIRVSSNKIDSNNKKSKSKFQKPSSNKKTQQKLLIQNSFSLNQKAPQFSLAAEQDSLAIDLQYIYPKGSLKINQSSPKTQQFTSDVFCQEANYLKQKNENNNSDTRDTCELAPSKLEELIKVQDNKYKQMILKNFYKKQK